MASDPSKVAAQDEFGGDTSPTNIDSNKQSFEEQVNTAVGKMTKGDDGNWVLPEDLSDEVKFATGLEKRRRDTQSSLDKSTQSLKASESKGDKYLKRLTANVQVDLSDEEQEELAELKTTDPDAWRQKIGEYEQRAADSLQEELGTDNEDASEAAEVERRGQVLKDFLDTNPELVLNDEVFKNDLPPRITGKLSRGEVSFEEFLTEAKKFLNGTKEKIGDGNDLEKEPDLNKASGGSHVSKDAIKEDLKESYKNVVF